MLHNAQGSLWIGCGACWVFTVKTVLENEFSIGIITRKCAQPALRHCDLLLWEQCQGRSLMVGATRELLFPAPSQHHAPPQKPAAQVRDLPVPVPQELLQDHGQRVPAEAGDPIRVPS